MRRAKMMEVRNDQGRLFGVRVVRLGERWGRNDCLVHDKADPLVEFYDLSYRNDPRGERGQFVSNYYLSTLLEGLVGQGINLQGGVPVWQIDGQAMDQVRAYLRELPEAKEAA